MSKEPGFIARWSQRKLAERRGLDPESAPDNAPPIAAPVAPSVPAGDSSIPQELPPIDSLTKDSDFTPFLRAGVPAELRLAALRKLWTSDPVWALPERLDIHNLDYTFPSVPQLVQTAYRVGRGFLDAAEKTAETAAPPTPTAGGSTIGSAAAREGDDTHIDHPQVVGCNDPGGSSG
jgi:hypothetical protein